MSSSQTELIPGNRQHFWLRTAVRIGAAGLAAGLLALLVLMPVREQRLLVGRPGDASAVGGLSLPSTYGDKPGRWSRGDGRITFPDCPLPAVASLDLATLSERLPDPIEIVVNDMRVQRLTLACVRRPGRGSRSRSRHSCWG